jgi:two-component system nitrogen regulation response regulator GlnG
MTSELLSECAPEPLAPLPKTAADLEALDITQLVGRLLREGEAEIYRKVGLAVDRAVVQAVLRHTKGNQVQASEILGISRTTLRAKLRTLGVAIEKHLSTESDQTA